MKRFLRENKGKALLSSVIVLLPVLVGLLFWDRLPERMITHWGADGVADGQSGKAFAVFAVPLIVLALHWLCLLCTAADKGNWEQNPKAMGLLFWIMPAVSLGANAAVYAAAFGRELDGAFLLPVLMALLFIVFGNYLPKIKQNSTMGIKVVWALRNEENWNATHRFCGKLWVAGGFLLLAAMLLPGEALYAVLLADLLVLAAAPVLYSWLYYRRQCSRGSYRAKEEVLTPGQKKLGRAGMIFVMAVLVCVGLLMVTGSLEYQFGEDSVTVRASYYEDLMVAYEKIESIQLRAQDDPGQRTNGWGSLMLSMGTFANEEFGAYTRYTYTGEECCIVLRSGAYVLVLGGKTPEETRQIYETLLEKTGRVE